jgi:microcystin-dependent protein
MAQPYVGEIRMFAGNFAPVGWEFCSGQLLPISENEVLFQLIGTTYGGDGQVTFALPDLRGRVPIHQGATFILGEMSGVEDVTLTVAQMPGHTHGLLVSTGNATTQHPENNLLSMPTTTLMYRPSATPNANMATNIIGLQGASMPHSNMQPSLGINFIISLYGIFPTVN